MRLFRIGAVTSFPAIESLRRGTLLLAGVLLLLAVAINPTLARAGGGISSGGSNGGSGSDKSIDPSAITGVPRDYAKFSVILAGSTGLSPRVVAGWTLAEGGPKDNPLNMGPGNRYGTVRRGARAAEQNLRSDLYRNIMRSANRADTAQIDAIVASPWCPGCKGYNRLLRSTYHAVHVDG